jgi:hypothetical protein
MRFFQRIRRLFDLFPWTPLGLLIAGASIGMLRFFGFAELDLVLLVVGYTSLVLTGVAALFVAVATLLLKYRIRPNEQSQTVLLETEISMETGFSIPSLTFVPFVQMRWKWEQPRKATIKNERRRGRIREIACLSDRGQFRSVVRRLVVEDAFGLSRMTIRMVDMIALDVLPHLGALRHMPAILSMAGGDELPHPMGIDAGDRLELQRYVAGDPARFIHWKVFGRTRKLMIRAPERALVLSHRTAAFIVSGPDDDATAAVARLAIEKRMLGSDWSFGSDEKVDGASEPAEALAILMRSSGVRDREGAGLRAFLEHVEKKGPASSIVFIPPSNGPWIKRILDLARVRRVHVVIGIDGMSSETRESLWRRLTSIPEPPTGTPARQLQQAIEALKRGNCQITILDRTTGKPITEHHWRAGPSPAIAAQMPREL